MKRSKMQTAVFVLGGVIVIVLMLLFARSRMSTRPTNLGVVDGKLAPEPSSPNCVLTQTASAEHRIAPFEFEGDIEDAMPCLRKIVAAEANATIIEKTDDYLYAEFRSRLFRFVDDVEFYVDADAGKVHFRSASRTGYSDLGVNRTRMERLRIAFADCCGNASNE